MTVCRVWNRWVQEDHMERCAGFLWSAITNNWKNRHLTLALMQAYSHFVSSERRNGIVCKTTSVCTNSLTIFKAAWTISLATMASATLESTSQCLQWCVQLQTWTHEWNDDIFSNGSRFCFQHHDGRMRIWRHRGVHTLVACSWHRHIVPSPGVMVGGDTGYTSWSPLVCIGGTLNSGHYISVVLRHVLYVSAR